MEVTSDVWTCSRGGIEFFRFVRVTPGVGRVKRVCVRKIERKFEGS
jgi:hypothetical protein